MPSASDLPSRRAIVQAILAEPGVHFRALLDRVGLAQGTLQYHLRVLVEEGLVQERHDGGFTRYHPVGKLGPLDQATVDALRREYGRRIIVALAADGPATTSALAERLGKAPSTVSWHLARLVEAGIVQKHREGQEVLYALVDPQRAVRLYTLHRGTLLDRLADRMLGLWKD